MSSERIRLLVGIGVAALVVVLGVVFWPVVDPAAGAPDSLQLGLLIFAGVLALAFPLGAFGLEKWGIRSRFELLALGLAASAAAIAVRTFVPWGTVPWWLWYGFLGTLALGALGASVTWRVLPWARPGRGSLRGLPTAIVCAALLVGAVAAAIVVAIR